MQRQTEGERKARRQMERDGRTDSKRQTVKRKRQREKCEEYELRRQMERDGRKEREREREILETIIP